MRAISQIPVSFPFQSILDEGVEHLAIGTQPTNDLIVPSTKRIAQGGGYVVGVAGFSDTPVAFKFQGTKNESGVIFCRPGQKFRVGGGFDAVEYGLPFGWLGGGNAVIFVGHSPDADFDLGPSRSELVFHRVDITIEASASPLPAMKRNWPLTFPWSNAIRSVVGGSADQRGSPIIRVEPTRALMRLYQSGGLDDQGFATPKTVGLIFRSSREFDNPLGNPADYSPPEDQVGIEVTFPAWSDPTFRPKMFATIPEDILRLDCSDGGLTIVNLGDAELTDMEINIIRFGRI